MGNFYGTVRCSVCYKRGHNKRSCPEYTKRLQSQLERLKERVDAGDTAWTTSLETIAQKLGKRTGTDPLSGKTITKRGPDRMCSYCKYIHGSYSDEGRGHNRRTCAQLKKDKQKAIEANATYRAGILEILRKSGVGVGSLIAHKIHGYFRDSDDEEVWSTRKVTTMVRAIQWDAVCYLQDDATVLQVQRMDKMGSTDGLEGIGIPLARDAEGLLLRFDRQGGWRARSGRVYGRWHATHDEPETQDTSLLSAVPCDTIKPPEGWEDGKSQVIHDHFKNLKD